MIDSPAVAAKKALAWTALLVSVVGILAVFGYVRWTVDQIPHRNDKAICSANLRQLGLAMFEYVQDNDQRFPPGDSTGLGNGWAGAIYPYVKSTSCYYCPAESDPIADDDERNASRLSYSINATLTADRQSPNCSPLAASLLNPKSTVMLFETTGPVVRVQKLDEGRSAGEHTGWYSGAGNGMENPPNGPATNLYAWGEVDYATGDIGTRRGGSSLSRHHGYANYLAADGHVISLRPWQVSSGVTSRVPGGQTGGPFSGAAATTDRLGHFRLTFSAR